MGILVESYVNPTRIPWEPHGNTTTTTTLATGARSARRAALVPRQRAGRHHRPQILPVEAVVKRVERVPIDAPADAAVARLNAEAPSVRSHRRPIGRDAALSALDAAFRGEGPEPVDPGPS